MSYRVDPPVIAAGLVLRAVVRVTVDAARVGPRGVAGFGDKRPVAVIIGTGAGARLVGLDGQPRDPTRFGLGPEDIA